MHHPFFDLVSADCLCTESPSPAAWASVVLPNPDGPVTTISVGRGATTQYAALPFPSGT